MKILKYSLLSAALVFFISCSKDDNPEVNSSLVLGEWDFEEFTYSGTSTTTIGGESATSTYTGEAYDLDAGINFESDGNYSVQGKYIIKLTNTVYGQTMVQDYPFTGINVTGKYRIEGNKMFVTANVPAGGINLNPTGTTEGVIVELTVNRLVIASKQEANVTEQGVQVKIIHEEYQVFTR